MFYFLLKAPYRKIGGYGHFMAYENMTAREAWDRFGKGNGVRSVDELISRCTKYTEKRSLGHVANLNPTIGCIILSNPICFDNDKFTSPEENGISFPIQIVKIKYFDGDGLFSEQQTLPVSSLFSLISHEQSYKQVKAKDRKGQSKFRQQVLEAYDYKCAMTGETCAEVLQAAHIQAYISEESNHIQNGICLRTDLHTLFDAGLVTIDTNYRVQVSSYQASPNYTALNGQSIILPTRIEHRPSVSALEFHRSNVFRS